MIAYIIMIISFIFENAYSLVVYNPGSLFLSCFPLVTIFMVYRLFKGNDKKYLISCFIYGFIYDIVFTNTLLLNALLFLLFAFIISKIYEMFQMHIFNIIIITLCLIILYRLCNYLIYISVIHGSFSYALLLKSFYSSIIINIIYMLLLNFIVSKICHKKY